MLKYIVGQKKVSLLIVAVILSSDNQFSPRDALVHNAVLRLHVVRLSVCPSVHPSVRL